MNEVCSKHPNQELRHRCVILSLEDPPYTRLEVEPCPICRNETYLRAYADGYKDGHKGGIEYAQDVLGEDEG